MKDNIDVAGFYSTVACKEATYLASQDATVVARLKAAGAIVVVTTRTSLQPVWSVYVLHTVQ